MNKLTLCTVLIIISLQGALLAQTNDDSPLKPRTKTQRIFDPCTNWNIRYRDIVTLKNAKMILELVTITDYQRFMHMDSLLMDFKKDVAFYKDSLGNMGTGHVRIDYVISENTGAKKIRFKKYQPDGESFVNLNGKVSKLKVEQDTVCIIIDKKVKVYRDYYEYSNIQATFLLNNYTEVDELIAAQADIAHIVDTLMQVKRAKYYYTDTFANNYNRRYATTYYWPYGSSHERFKMIDGLSHNEIDFFTTKKKQDFLTADFNIGVGLIRNQLAPCADAGLQIVKSFRKYNLEGYNYYGIYVSPYFLFEKNSNGDYISNTNVFLNAQFGGDGNSTLSLFGLKTTKWDIGLGYLIKSKGNYFKNTTMKAYLNIKLFNSITLSPEIIATDNFKQIFPGITLKVF